ncbi:protein SODIUM POTASSIUM ROOT DEFECTIVE 2-like [Mercurialis annua]|uniref:protein SODIUM POTASSIUM ROOT DEFECTIVE 2-like n=1 Tax=Mercurialis annua TaxID=3986 RepID=UPI00215E80A0|nr:protein SODIUM POTASSIUM ROOT DEFECTIVE 2-like [Mercurialis annua]
MKRMEIFCVSQASTAISMSMDQPSSSCSSSSSIQLGGRNIDRHNPIIRDQKRTPRTLQLAPPCTSQTLPINPQPYHLLHNSTKTSNKENDHTKNKKNKNKKKNISSKKLQNDVLVVQKNPVGGGDGDDDKKKKKGIICSSAKDEVVFQTKRWAQGDLVTPAGSTRYLLGDNSNKDFDLIDGFNDPVLALVSATNSNRFAHQQQSTSSNPVSSSISQEKPSNQVVVLRVSLHCRGCEGKVRKHISRMEGVSSFNIDFAAKKVTIVGNVTPLGVLASVSKVKTAQFWTSATTPAPALPSQLHK